MIPVFTPPISVSPGETPNNSHGGITASGDDLYVIWEGSANDVRFIRSADEGQNWTSAVTIGGATDEIPLTKCIAVQGQYVHVLYSNDSRDAGLPVQLKYVRSTDGGATWQTPLTLDNGSGFANDRFLRVSIVCEGSDVHVVYSSEDSSTHVGSPLYYRKSTDNGATFAARTTIGSGTNTTRPETDYSDGVLHVVWTDARDGSILNGGETYYCKSTDQGASFSTEVKLSNSTFHSTARPSVAAEFQHVVCVWQDPQNGDPNELWEVHSSDHGDAWSSPVLIVSGTDEQEHPTVDCASGVTMLVYTNWDTTPNSTYAKVSLDYGPSWGAGAQVHVPAADTGAPLVVMSSRFACVMDRQSATDGLQLARSPVFEDDPSAALLDNFERASLGGNWTTPGVLNTNPQLVIVSSQFLTRDSSGSYRQGGYWNAGTFTNLDMIVDIADRVYEAGDGMAMFVRLAAPGTAGVDGYGVLIGNDGAAWDWTLTVITNAATPVTATGLFPDLTPGDSLALRMNGNLLLLWQKNAGVWRQVGVILDDTWTAAGNIGLEFLNDQDTKVGNLYASEISELAEMAWVTTL